MNPTVQTPSIKERIEALQARVSEMERLLPYADGPAYGQDKQRISKMRREIVELEECVKRT